MATLTNTKIKDTYDGLLKTTDNDVIGTTEKVITDGLGNASILSIGTQSASFSEDIEINGHTIGKGSGDIGTNVVLGTGTLTSNTTGNNNVAIGVNSSLSNTTGVRNISIGTEVLVNNTTGSANIALGFNSLYHITGSDNIAIGRAAGQYSTGTLDKTAGDQNVYIGANIVSGAQDTDNEIVIGYNTTGNGSNTATYGNNSITDHYFNGNVRADFFYGDGSNLTNLPVGAIPTLDQVTGAGATSSVNVTINGADLGTIGVSNNTLLGEDALTAHTSGTDNTAIGYRTLDAKTSGSENTAIGAEALGNGTSLNYNTAVGNLSLFHISGLRNTAIGNNAGRYRNGMIAKTLGDDNVYIGANTVSADTDTDNEIVIGANATGNGSNSATYGDSNITKHIFTAGSVGIGTPSPADIIDIQKNQNATTNFYFRNTDTTNTNSRSILNVDAGNVGLDFQVINGDHSYISASSNLYVQAASQSIFWTGGSESMRIDSSGNVGIGTSSPAAGYLLDVNGGINMAYSGTGSNAINQSTASGFGNIKPFSNAGFFDFDTNFSSGGGYRFHYNGGEKMRIDSSGNVGIGTAPNRLLHLYGGAASTTWLLMNNSATGSATTDGFSIAQTGVDVSFINREVGYIDFQTSDVPRMRITSVGDVLIGTTGIPNGTSVYGSGFTPTTNGRSLLRMASSSTSSSTLAVFYNPNGSVGSIVTSGSSTAFNTSSDYRLKENVVEMTGALDRVDALKPSRFNFIADPETTVDGFLAHEVAEVIPEAVTGEKDAVDEEGNPIYQGIDQSKIVPLLVGAIKELRAEIELLKSQING